VTAASALIERAHDPMIGPMHASLGRGASFILTLEVIDRAMLEIHRLRDEHHHVFARGNSRQLPGLARSRNDELRLRALSVTRQKKFSPCATMLRVFLEFEEVLTR
jgi:hypothetical protein